MLEARGLSKRFILRHNRSGSLKVRFLGLLHREQREVLEEFWALKQVSFSIGRGEAVGLIGRNGSGKSTLLKLIAGIHRPTNGLLRIARGARVGTMIELGVGFHPELSGSENVALNAAVHGLSRPEIEAIYPRVVEYSGLEHFMDIPIKNFSSGMHLRLGFAIAANLNPDVLLLDEIFAVGDADFQKQCMKTMEHFRAQGKTILFVSHSAAAVHAICGRVCLLDHGELRYDGGVQEGFREYQLLLQSTSAPASSGLPAVAPVDPLASSAVKRRIPGDLWDEVGRSAFEFIRQQGLTPNHFLLEVGCGGLPAAVHLIPYLEPGHYWGLERDATLVRTGLQVDLPRAGVPTDRGQFVVSEQCDPTDLPQQFDFAIAHTPSAELPLNALARCIATVTRKLRPEGRFYVSWFDNPDPASFEPVQRPGGVTTYADAPPYHYTFETLSRLCETIGVRAEPVEGWAHPTGERVMVITSRPS